MKNRRIRQYFMQRNKGSWIFTNVLLLSEVFVKRVGRLKG